jgi:hypothetical protein
MVKRRRGSRSAGTRTRPSRHRPFEALVDVALAAIPEPFAAALDEVAIVIDDEPTADQRRENDIADDDTLYGLYEGVPRTGGAPTGRRYPIGSPCSGYPSKRTSRIPTSSPTRSGVTVIHEFGASPGDRRFRLEELGVD